MFKATHFNTTFKTLLLALLLSFSILGCQQDDVTHFPKQKKVQITNEMEKIIKNTFLQTLHFSFEESDEYLINANEKSMIESYKNLGTTLHIYQKVAEKSNQAISEALEASATALSNYDFSTITTEPVSFSVHTELQNELKWETMFSFLYAHHLLALPPSNESLLQKNTDIDIQITYQKEENHYDIVVVAIAPTFEKLWLHSVDKPTEYLTGKLSHAYLLTLYDEKGKEKAYSEPDHTALHLKNIIQPVTEGQIRATWYAPRDGGARKHTGTDIIAKESTPIHNIMEGTVLYVSYAEKPGNFMIIVDDSGYQHHYYHMQELPMQYHTGDRIKQGEIIGKVGNTGNSATPHLHLSIIHPNGQYINPYPYLTKARQLGR